MATISTIAGAILIVVALDDVLRTLFQPTGVGRLSQIIQRGTWSLFRWLGARTNVAFSVAGPAAVMTIIAVWATLVTVGWALIYWPRLPGDFVVSSGLKLGQQTHFVDAVYVSLVTLSTLGYGDIAPRGDVLRIVGAIEALVGFGLLTASLSWFLAIYGVLTRMRVLANLVALLGESERRLRVSLLDLEPAVVESTLADLTTRLVTLRGDFVRFPVTYYFSSQDERTSLANALPYLLALSEADERRDFPLGVRFRITGLSCALDDLCRTITDQFVRGCPAPSSRSEVIDAFVRDHVRGASRLLSEDSPAPS